MRRYLDLSSWVVLFTLLPFTVLILLSQNTVPGDLFYPIKRGLENIILAGSSISPSTKVAFRTDLTERRFKEAEQLLILQADTRPLSALVGEVQVTQEELFKISSFEDKKELSEKLIAKIDEYETKLAVVQTQIEQQPIQIPLQPTAPPAQPQPGADQPRAETPAPFQPVPPPETAAPVAQTPVPTATSKPFIQIPFRPQATPAPTPAPILNTAKKEEVVTKVEETREKLKEFREHLKKEKEEAEVKEKFKEEQEKFRENLEKGRRNSGPAKQDLAPRDRNENNH